MARVPFVCGNWKMNKNVPASLELVDELLGSVGPIQGVEIGIAPTFLALHPVRKKIQAGKLRLAAQNVHFESDGAYTGEVSVSMLKDLGCDYVLVGHSERRQYFGETNASCAKKTGAALRGGLRVIYCIGETLAERDAGRHFDVVSLQLREGLTELERGRASDLVLAYEPVWAIGTGRTATPDQAQEMHAHIRARIAETFGAEVAAELRIQYGGSVKASNADELFEQPDIDGGLIGGAALDAQGFLSICRSARSRG